GNFGATTRTFVRDTIPPSVTVASHVDGAMTATSITVSGSCEVGLAVSFSGTASPSPSSTTCSPGGYAQTLTLAAADGGVQLVIGQSDGAGNFGSATLNLIKDTDPPDLAISFPPDAGITGASATITGSCETGLTVTLGGTSLPSPMSTPCVAGG